MQKLISELREQYFYIKKKSFRISGWEKWHWFLQRQIHRQNKLICIISYNLSVCSISFMLLTRVSKGIFCIYTDLQNGKLFQNSLGREGKKGGCFLLFLSIMEYSEFRCRRCFFFYYKGLLIECLNKISLIYFQKNSSGSMNRSQKEWQGRDNTRSLQHKWMVKHK